MKHMLVALMVVGAASWAAAQDNGGHANTMQLPPAMVTATNQLSEELPLGPNQQPEWTARRRFTTTRVYVQPPWQMEAEVGLDTSFPREGIPHHVLTEEFELGLPYRFQFDYESAEAVDGGHWKYDSSSVELRWALAEWGRIPLNPTIKAEWRINNAAADAYELSLALGDELAPRWHYGVNFFYEQQVGDDRETEHAVSAALSYTLIDEKLSVGIESKLGTENDNGDRVWHLAWLIGPSVQWRPTERTHLDVVPLLGATGPAPRVELFVFFGIDFGPGAEREEAVSPASLRAR